MKVLRRTAVARFLTVGIMAAAMAVLPTPARALIISGIDFGPISGSIGQLYQNDTMTSNFMTPDLSGQGGPAPTSIGQDTSSVYYNGSVFTYVLQVTPSIANETRVSTGFLPTLSSNTAGWTFSQAPSPYTIILNTTNLSWTTLVGSWSAGSEVDFFFQSLMSPGVSTYNLGAAQVGTASGFAPVGPPVSVPEPSSLLLLGSGAIGMGIASRRLRGRGRRTA